MHFDRYYAFDEMAEAMRALERAYPGMAKLNSAGKSYEGRDLWVLEITNRSSGPAQEKPGFYIDGNTHGGEVTGSMIALFTAYYLLSSYGLDKEVTASLDSRVWYILPRVNPDGAEAYLTSSFAGSGTRRGPGDTQGVFYHLYPEGYIKNYNGREVKIAPPRDMAAFKATGETGARSRAMLVSVCIYARSRARWIFSMTLMAS